MNPFTELGARIFALVAVALALAVTFQTIRLNSAQSALEAKRNQLATCEAQHAVTRQSVGTLENVIEDLNNRALARAEAYAEGAAEAEKRSAELAKARQESNRVMEQLRRAVREQVNGDCPTPSELRDLARGL